MQPWRDEHDVDERRTGAASSRGAQKVRSKAKARPPRVVARRSALVEACGAVWTSCSGATVHTHTHTKMSEPDLSGAVSAFLRGKAASGTGGPSQVQVTEGYSLQTGALRTRS